MLIGYIGNERSKILPQCDRGLKGTLDRSLKFRKSECPLELIGFSDSDWGANISDRKSISGYSFQLSEHGPLVSWQSKKQQTVALSTCKAEYIALAGAVQEGKYLRQLCIDFKILKTDSSVSLNVDNQGAIKLAKNPMLHKRSKHTDIRYHFIRNELQQGYKWLCKLDSKR